MNSLRMALVVLLLWVYYSAQILFFGAEFMQVYANNFGSHSVADEAAVPVTSAISQPANN
jgi:membrane protein